MCDVELDGRALGLQSSYVHVKTDDLYRPNARFTQERLGYQVLTPFGKLGYSQIFLTLKEAADYSGLPKAWLLRDIKSGKLQAIKAGGWRIRRSALDHL